MELDSLILPSTDVDLGPGNIDYRDLLYKILCLHKQVYNTWNMFYKSKLYIL